MSGAPARARIREARNAKEAKDGAHAQTAQTRRIPLGIKSAAARDKTSRHALAPCARAQTARAPAAHIDPAASAVGRQYHRSRACAGRQLVLVP